jgi:DNA-binding transcriptional regulator of glucitol operon
MCIIIIIIIIIILLQLGWHQVAVVQYTFRHKQYTEYLLTGKGCDLCNFRSSSDQA